MHVCVFGMGKVNEFCFAAGKGMLIQPCENEIVPEHSLVFLCPDLGSHRAKYAALETTV